MGRKPVLGMASALCIGLALTGCRDAATRSDGPTLSKTNGPVYNPQPAFSMNSGNTTNPAAPASGWNNGPTTAGKNGAWQGGAPASAPTTPGAPVGAGMNTGRPTTNIQTTGATVPPAPPSPPDYDIAPPPAGESHFAPPSNEMHTIQGTSGHVLAPTPSLTGQGIPAILPEAPPSPPGPVQPAVDNSTQIPLPPAPVPPAPPADLTPSSGAASPPSLNLPPPPPVPGPDR